MNGDKDMQSQPLVTVYVTNHNYAQYVAQAIESVLAQTMSDWELLIIDDGSTDASREIIERYEGHSGVRIIFQQQQGLNVTNNIALRVARGRYIMRLDADDYLDPNALLVLSSALEKDKALGLVFPDYYKVDGDGRFLGMDRRHNFSEDVTLFDQPAHGACTMIRRDALLDVGGYDASFSCQDGYDAWIKLLARYKVTNVNLPLFYYRQHGKNLTRDERRLLTTRTEIKEAYRRKQGAALRGTAVIPVRDAKQLALRPLGEGVVLDWNIRAALGARHIERIIITSSEEIVQKHVNNAFSGEERICFVERSRELERLNVSADETLRYLLENEPLKTNKPHVLILLSVKNPFLSARYIDDCVNTLSIFGADSVIGVRPETAKLFQHSGGGLHPILGQERFTQLERDMLFRYAGGVSALRIETLDSRKHGEAERLSHVVVDEMSAFPIDSALNWEIAQTLSMSKK